MLPTKVQVALAAADCSTMDAMSTLADRVNEILANTNRAITPITHSGDIRTDRWRQSMKDLSEEVEALTQRFDKLCSHARSRSRRNRSKSKSSRATSNNSTHATDHCYYHRRFGENAEECSQPCGFPDQNQEN